jgi:hypothetical protein
MTLASSNADALRLLHCGPGVADTVVYGPSENGIATNPDMILDDTETVATSAAPKPQEGLSIARYIDGRDTNQSGVDFTVSVDNTPGSPNPEIVCGDGDFQVKINEIIPNPDGTDSGQEWIELYNAGTADVRLDAWKIEVASSSWSTKVTLPYDITISPGQFFLIGESDVPPEFADYRIDSSLSLGNASTGLDGVRLVNCLGGIEDTLLYGKVGAVLDPEEELFDDQGNSTFAFLSDSGKTIGRSTDGVDTDDNAADFATNMVPTPRAANVGGSGDTGTNTTEVPSKGCNKSAEPSDSDPSKCSYVDGISPYLWVSTLFVLYRRRET